MPVRVDPREVGGRGPGFEVRLSAWGPLQLLNRAQPKASPCSWGRRGAPESGREGRASKGVSGTDSELGQEEGPGLRTGVRAPGRRCLLREHVCTSGGGRRWRDRGQRRLVTAWGELPSPEGPGPRNPPSPERPGPRDPSRPPPRYPRKPLLSVCSFYSSGVRKTEVNT